MFVLIRILMIFVVLFDNVIWGIFLNLFFNFFVDNDFKLLLNNVCEIWIVLFNVFLLWINLVIFLVNVFWVLCKCGVLFLDCFKWLIFFFFKKVKYFKNLIIFLFDWLI